MWYKEGAFRRFSHYGSGNIRQVTRLREGVKVMRGGVNVMNLSQYVHLKVLVSNPECDGP